MNQMAIFYAAFAMVALAVLSNRYWRRQIRKTQAAAEKARLKVEDLTKEAAKSANYLMSLTNDLSITENRSKRTEVELAAAKQDIEALKKAASDRYYVFDRLEPRQGGFWIVTIRFQPLTVEDRSRRPGWDGLRRYILIAEGERDAKHRAAARFSRKSGFEVIQAVTSRIANLTISRINDFSTFRHPDRDEEA